MEPLTISGPALILCGGIGSILCGAITFLQRSAMTQLTARAERAERQVDTLLPAITQLTGAVERIGDKI